MMKEIDLKKDVKKQFEKSGLSYPRLKSSGYYGLRGSTLLDRTTEKESLSATVDYLKRLGVIKVKKVV